MDKKDTEIKKLIEAFNDLLTKIHEAGNLLDNGDLTDASNKLDEAKFKYNLIPLEKEIFKFFYITIFFE